ncbi:MAG: hypothetical protein ACR2PM_03145 [Hyphomicrobiales bacterium]
MITALRTVLFLVILALAGVGLFVLLPFAKEGASLNDMGVFGGVIAAALLLGLMWWLAVGRTFELALLGWGVLALPVAAHGAIAVSLLVAYYQGQRLAAATEISGYQEEPIQWPGFDGPIGLKVTVDLAHPSGASAVIQPPEIRMGPAVEIQRRHLVASLRSGSGYFKDIYLDKPVGALVLLKPVLFQRVFRNETARRPLYRWSASADFAAGERTTLIYHLLPGTVDYLPNRNRICLTNRSFGIPLCAAGQLPQTGCAPPHMGPVSEVTYGMGKDLSALWLASGASDLTVDLSAQLTASLRKSNILQSNPAAWTAMHKRLEPEGLIKAGYELCPPGDESHTRFRTCYCRVVEE